MIKTSLISKLINKDHTIMRVFSTKLIRKILQRFSSNPVKADNFLLGSISLEDESGIKKAVDLAGAFEGPILEIGTLFGHTTNLIATLAEKGKQIITIDNFRWNPFGLSPEMHMQFTERTIRYILKHRNTYLFKGNASDFYANYNGVRPSMVFIDADHSYDAVKNDINWAFKLRIPVISGHDYSPLHPGVQKAVSDFFGTKIQIFGTVWIACLFQD